MVAYPLVRWRFYDPGTLETYTFAINPNDGGTPTREKQFQYQSTAAPNGKTLVFEGRDQPQKISFSGTLTDESQYTALNTWFDHVNQILLTDDLGREFYIVIETLTMTRKRNATTPWKHDYSVTATIVDYP